MLQFFFVIPRKCAKYFLIFLSVSKMPRTSSDKLKLGLTYISKLSLSHECRSFSGGVTNCKCICNCGLMLPQVQIF